MLDFYRVDQILEAPVTVWAFLGRALPIGTLILGVFLNRWFLQFDKKRRDRKSTNDLLTEIELLEAPLRRQGEHVAELVTLLNDRNKSVTKFTSVPSLMLDRIASMDRPAIIDHLHHELGSRQRAISAANRLFIGCDSLTDKYKELNRCVEEYLSRTGVLMDRWVVAANQLQRSFAEMLSHSKREGKVPTADPLIVEIATLTTGRNKTIQNPFLEYDEVHGPLAIVLARYWPDPRAERLAYSCSEIRDIIGALERERVYCRHRLNTSSEIMERLYQELRTLRESVLGKGVKG